MSNSFNVLNGLEIGSVCEMADLEETTSITLF